MNNIYVGIDVAKKKHDFYIVGENGEALSGSQTIRNDREGYQTLLQTIQQHASEPNKVIVGMEATGHYSDNILHYLLQQSFRVYLLNPKLVHQNNMANTLRCTKTDRTDAKSLALLMMNKYEAFTPYTLSSYHTSELKSLTRHRTRLVEERTKLKNDVRRLITILFPEIEQYFKNIHGAAVYAVLQAYPSAQQIANSRTGRLTKILAQSSRGYFEAEFAIRLRRAATNSIGMNSPARSEELVETLERLQTLQGYIVALEQRIEAEMQKVNNSS